MQYNAPNSTLHAADLKHTAQKCWLAAAQITCQTGLCHDPLFDTHSTMQGSRYLNALQYTVKDTALVILSSGHCVKTHSLTTVRCSAGTHTESHSASPCTVQDIALFRPTP